VEPELLLEPEQPDEVAVAVRDLLAERPRPVDPWWEAGIRDALTSAPDP
jgi:hypothetical protein